MKTENIAEAIRLLEARAVGDTTYGSAVAKAAREELAALSSVPEDVARDVEKVRKALRDGAQDENLLWDPPSPLSRLATAAARVPGLVTWQEAMLHVLGLGLDYTPTADKAVGVLKGIVSEAKEMEQRLAEARSERHVMEQDLAQRTRERDSEMEERWKCAEVRSALESRAESAEAERDAARQEAAALQEQVDAWKENCGLVDSSGDPDRVTPAHLAADLQNRDAEHERLTAQVAALEAEKKALEDGIQPMRDTRRLMGADLAAAEARATAAEAKAEELSQKGRALHDAASAAVNVMPDGRWRDDLVSALSANYFPPGETCAVCGGKGWDADTDEEGGTQNETRFACSMCKGSGKDTPALGLREAVDMTALRNALATADGYEVRLLADHEHDRQHYESLARAVVEHLSAYEATPVPPPPPSPGLREALDVEALSTVYNRAHLAESQRFRTENGSRGVKVAAHFAGIAAVVRALSVLASTPEPSVTHAALAAVAQEVIADSGEVLEKATTGRRVTLPEAQAYVRAVNDFVRRVTGGRVPEVLLKARVVEVLAREHDAQVKRGRQVPAAVVRHIANTLCLTLPTGPGGWEHKTCGMARHFYEQRISEPCTFDEGHGGRHSWEQDPPGPGGNPSTESNGAAESNPPTSSESSESCPNGCPELGQHEVCCPLAQPEPAAPEVVWEGDGMRVLEPDRVEVRTELTGGWVSDVSALPWRWRGRIARLARALAEAKRENATLRARVKEVEDDLRRQVSASLEAQTSAQKAAESMRERAEQAAYEAAAATRHPEQRDRFLALGHTIRALPLE